MAAIKECVMKKLLIALSLLMMGEIGAGRSAVTGVDTKVGVKDAVKATLGWVKGAIGIKKDVEAGVKELGQEFSNAVSALNWPRPNIKSIITYNIKTLSEENFPGAQEVENLQKDSKTDWESVLESFLNNTDNTFYKDYLMEIYQNSGEEMTDELARKCDIATVAVHTLTTVLEKYKKSQDSEIEKLIEKTESYFNQVVERTKNQHKRKWDTSLAKDEDDNLLEKKDLFQKLQTIVEMIEQLAPRLQVFLEIYNPKFTPDNLQQRLNEEMKKGFGVVKSLNKHHVQLCTLLENCIHQLFNRYNITEYTLDDLDQDSDQYPAYYVHMVQQCEALKDVYAYCIDETSKNLEKTSGSSIADIIEVETIKCRERINRYIPELKKRITGFKNVLKQHYEICYKHMEQDTSWWTKTKRVLTGSSSGKSSQQNSNGGLIGTTGRALSGIGKATSGFFSSLDKAAAEGYESLGALDIAKAKGYERSQDQLNQIKAEADQAQASIDRQKMQLRMQSKRMGPKNKKAQQKLKEKQRRLRTRERKLAAIAAAKEAEIRKHNETLALMQIARETGKSPLDMVKGQVATEFHKGMIMGALNLGTNAAGAVASGFGKINKPKSSPSFADLEDEDDEDDMEDEDDEDDEDMMDDEDEEEVRPVKKQKKQKYNRSNIQPVTERRRPQTALPTLPPLPESLSMTAQEADNMDFAE